MSNNPAEMFPVCLIIDADGVLTTEEANRWTYIDESERAPFPVLKAGAPRDIRERYNNTLERTKSFYGRDILAWMAAASPDPGVQWGFDPENTDNIDLKIEVLTKLAKWIPAEEIPNYKDIFDEETWKDMHDPNVLW